MLPALNLNAVSTDTGKQITYIKTYINNLKDQIDDELNSISYGQLDADLRKRIDRLNEDIKLADDKAVLVAELVKTNYLSANEIQAQYLTAQQITANYATIGAVNANSARISTIESNYVGTEYLEANYASIGSLNAALARIGVVEANYITAGAITAEFLNSKFSGATGLSASRIYCDSYHVNAEGQSYTLTPQRLVVGGVSKIILGA